MPDRIDLVTGHSALLVLAGYAVVLLAALGIVTSASPWLLKGIALCALAFAAWMSLGGMAGISSPGNGILHLDGTAVDTSGREEILLEYTGQAWVSRLFSVVHLRETDSGRKCSWLVCATNNHPDDYRRLMGYLRLGSMSMRGVDQ